MVAIKGKGNKTTEAEFLRQLRDHKISGWRRQPKKVYGSPDFLFRKARTVLFVDGCFWHGCKKHCIMPKSNRKYWNHKIARNKIRDRVVNAFYKAKGWKVLRIWEHDIQKSPEKAVRRLKNLVETNIDPQYSKKPSTIPPSHTYKKSPSTLSAHGKSPLCRF